MKYSDLKKYIDDQLTAEQLEMPVVFLLNNEFYEPNMITIVESTNEEQPYPEGQPIIL